MARSRLQQIESELMQDSYHVCLLLGRNVGLSIIGKKGDHPSIYCSRKKAEDISLVPMYLPTMRSLLRIGDGMEEVKNTLTRLDAEKSPSLPQMMKILRDSLYLDILFKNQVNYLEKITKPDSIEDIRALGESLRTELNDEEDFWIGDYRDQIEQSGEYVRRFPSSIFFAGKISNWFSRGLLSRTFKKLIEGGLEAYSSRYILGKVASRKEQLLREDEEYLGQEGYIAEKKEIRSVVECYGNISIWASQAASRTRDVLKKLMESAPSWGVSVKDIPEMEEINRIVLNRIPDLESRI